MRKPSRPVIATRKLPRQTRSADLVAAVREAATQVLANDGAARFTTARVAERAGVSVGSIYQYFPNKAAILFQIQADEWARTSEMLKRILEDERKPPLERLRELVHAFVRSECDEAPLRVALADLAPLYRDAPEAAQVRAAADRTMARYVRQVLPDVTAARRSLVCDLVTTTLGALGTSFSSEPRSEAEMRKYSDAMADMLCAYLRSMQRGR